MNGVYLTGLNGTNPIGFLAALGVQVAFSGESKQPRLWWSDDVIPCAVIDLEFDIDCIVEKASKTFFEWSKTSAVRPQHSNGSMILKGDELKFSPPDIREYLELSCNSQSGSTLITALVAEGSLDNQGAAKPSDLYFTAGQQKFLSIVREILGNATKNDVRIGLEGPWQYKSKLPSLMWDTRDDRDYALTSNNPSTEQKFTNPGVEALAILGLSLYKVFGSRNRTFTQGCSGSWKEGCFSWPLWCKPASHLAVRTLLAHAYDHPTAMKRTQWFPAWGISKVFRSPIRRSKDGGYGTFGPPDMVVDFQQSKVE